MLVAAEITAATRLVIVCNPNNPTSTALPYAGVAAIFLSALRRSEAPVVFEDGQAGFPLAPVNQDLALQV